MNIRSSAAVALLFGLTFHLFAGQQSAVNAQNFSRQQAEKVAAEEEVQRPVKKRKKLKAAVAAPQKKPAEPEADIFKLFNFNKPAAQQADAVEPEDTPKKKRATKPAKTKVVVNPEDID